MKSVPDTADLAGLRVLVVEDDFFVAESLRVILSAMGCEVVGPASTAEEACSLVEHVRINAAVLDTTLSPGTSTPVARALQDRGCPFVFVTGYSSIGMLPDDLRRHRILHKPVDLELLTSVLREMMRDVGTKRRGTGAGRRGGTEAEGA